MRTLRAAGLGVCLGLLGMMQAAQAQAEPPCPPETGYRPADETEPGEAWCKRTREYWTEMLQHARKKEACAAGSRQSPIALTSPPTSPDLRPIQFNYIAPEHDTGRYLLLNNGHTVELALWEMDRSIVFAGQTFNLKTAHFHYPSEHVVDRERFALEIHLVHYHPWGPHHGKAVVGILVRKGEKENAALNAMFGPMSGKVRLERTVRIEGDRLREILPRNKSYLTYPGSLTTPSGRTGCDEDVTWLVLTTPLQASQAQIDKFKAAISYDHPFKVNARPLTDEEGRVRTSTARDVKRWSWR